MDKDIKAHIMNLMKGGTGGCKHLEMGQALACSTCQMKMVHAQSEYNRLRKEHPKKFIRNDDPDTYSRKTQNLGDMLDERIKNDKLYQNHLKILAFGSEQEKKREYKRIFSGYYEKHTGDRLKTMIL